MKTGGSAAFSSFLSLVLSVLFCFFFFFSKNPSVTVDVFLIQRGSFVVSYQLMWWTSYYIVRDHT